MLRTIEMHFKENSVTGHQPVISTAKKLNSVLKS